jgi:hypothetical protein
MTDARDLSEGFDPGVAESAKTAAADRKAAEDQAFSDKLAKLLPPNPVERAEIKKARKRTKARAPRIKPSLRPVDYTREIGSCGRLFNGETLSEICRDAAMPDKPTVMRWLAQHPKFLDEYVFTCELLVDDLVAEAVSAAGSAPAWAAKHATSIGSNIVTLAVISVTSTMPVSGARTTPVKKAVGARDFACSCFEPRIA